MDELRAPAQRTKAASPGAKSAKQTGRKKRNTAGRPTADELDRRKTKAIEVATALFIKEGYAATSLVDIARGAGVATRTLYQHFGDKEAMFREVIFARDVHYTISAPTVVDGDTLFTALQRAAQYAYAITYREQSIGLMRLMIAESGRFPQFMKTVATSIFARFRRNIEKVFESLEDAGVISAGNHERSAELFSDLMLGAHPIMTYTNWDATPPDDKDADERVELFILGRFGAEVAAEARSKKAKA
jgi:AcrR family transcriptional regulator